MGERMDGYIRVSRRGGRSGASYISPDVQREAIERWAEYKRVEIVEWHFDEDWSGGSQTRPGLERAIARCLAHETGGIVSWKIDRFSRFTEGGLRDLRRLQEVGARLAFVSEDLDLSGPIGKVVYTIMLSQAEYFLDNIKAQWAIAHQRAFARGAYITRTPAGYARQEDGSITPHPIDGPVMRQAFLIAGTQGITKAARYVSENLTAERVTTTATVRRMLARRVYLGETDIKGFKGITHEPLVSRIEWEMAQGQYADRADAETFPLSGLAVCGNCGQHMVGGHGGQQNRRTYRCAAAWTKARAKHLRPCERGVVIIADRLEGYVAERARALAPRLRVTVGDNDAERRAELEDDIGELAEDLDAFVGDTTLRRVLGDRYQAHLDAKMAALEMKRDELRQHERGAHIVGTWGAGSLLSTSDPESLSTGARALFSKVVVSPGRGLPVEARVSLVEVDDDSRAGVAGAK